MKDLSPFRLYEEVSRDQQLNDQLIKEIAANIGISVEFLNKLIRFGKDVDLLPEGQEKEIKKHSFNVKWQTMKKVMDYYKRGMFDTPIE
jgi:hypothetical protein